MGGGLQEEVLFELRTKGVCVCEKSVVGEMLSKQRKKQCKGPVVETS